jgi:Raf kinase inhibitor-like YbhB/YbcL family protein
MHFRTHRPLAAASLMIGLLLAVVALTQLGCSRVVIPPGVPSLELSSDSFTEGNISKTSTCDGQEASPELSWNTPPGNTQSLVLLVTDKDSLFGYSFVHWVLYDLPADKRELPAGVAKQEQLPDGSRQGNNDDDKIGYLGPCPPGKSSHRYVFALYALDTKLSLSPGATKKEVVKAMNGHVLAAGELIGRYHR